MLVPILDETGSSELARLGDAAVVEAVLDAARRAPGGERAALVGEVTEGPAKVSLRTPLGATRPLIMLAGDQLPRIC